MTGSPRQSPPRIVMNIFLLILLVAVTMRFAPYRSELTKLKISADNYRKLGDLNA